MRFGLLNKCNFYIKDKNISIKKWAELFFPVHRSSHNNSANMLPAHAFTLINYSPTMLPLSVTFGSSFQHSFYLLKGLCHGDLDELSGNMPEGMSQRLHQRLFQGRTTRTWSLISLELQSWRFFLVDKKEKENTRTIMRTFVFKLQSTSARVETTNIFWVTEYSVGS